MRFKLNFCLIWDVKSISKLIGSCILCNFHWVWIDMNHASPYPLMMLPLPRFIYTSQKKEGAWTSMNCTPRNFNYFTFTFRDDYSEYEDCMDISKCIPSIRVSDLSLRDSPEKQITLVSSSPSPKGAIG